MERREQTGGGGGARREKETERMKRKNIPWRLRGRFQTGSVETSGAQLAARGAPQQTLSDI